MTQRESRIFPACTVAALVVLLAVVPVRYRMLPEGFEIGIGAAVVLVITIAGFSPIGSLWTRIETAVVIAVAVFVTALELSILSRLLYDMAARSQTVSAIALLSTAVAIWVGNVVVFALVYWQIDRGGPDGRATKWRGRVDFSFPRGEPEDGVPEDWHPVFADYLFLSFTASTAFSPTDALPLTVRGKMLMMAQGAVSLVTVVAVAARAINVLGS